MVLAVMVASLVLLGCGKSGAGSGEPADAPALSVPGLLVGRADVPAIESADRIALIEAAVAASFDRPTGQLVGRVRVEYAGIDVELVTHLDWNGDSGRASREMKVDDRYLSDQRVREFVASTNRDYAAEDGDLQGDGLREAIVSAERDVVDLLEGMTPEPMGLGWWGGSSGGDLDPQTLSLVIIDGRLRSITRSAVLVGSAVSDEWKFVE